MKRMGYLTAAGLGLALSMSLAGPVAACGGFFCQTQPMDQAGERIVFAKDGEEVSVTVQIVYSGAAKDFSWILPACTNKPSPPRVAPGPESLFQAIDFPTRPLFQIEPRTVEGTCKAADFGGGRGDVTFASTPQVAPAAAENGVTVISRENIGPYDTAILQSENAGSLRKWLQDNAYNVPPNLDTLIAPYVAQKAYFVALRLRPDRDTGDLAPIVIRYPAAKPEIPIRLTSVAAKQDMGILVYMLGNHRAIPENFKHVQINEALVDWTSGGSNYNQVVTAAVNEADKGQALVTDYAGPSSVVRDSLVGDRYDTALLRTVTDPALFVQTMLSQGFPSTSQVQSVIKRHIPIPASLQGQVTEQQFYNNLSQYNQQLRSQPFNPVAFANDLDELIVAPYRAARDLFTKLPYLTRLYTTMSPAEMSEDPLFSYNPDLPPVAQTRKAAGTVLCNPEVFEWQAPVKITLADGRTVVQAPPSSGPFPMPIAIGLPVGFNPSQPRAAVAPLPSGVPAALVVEQLKETGPAVTVKDNRGAIAALPAPSIPPTASKAAGGMGCAGCSNPARMSGNPSEVMLLGGLAAGVGSRRAFRRKKR